jgi:hypothetical protein
MMKNVYEIRLKMSGADSSDLFEAEVACFDSAAMIVLGSIPGTAEAEYSAKVCVWAWDAIRQALVACNKSSSLSKGASQLYVLENEKSRVFQLLLCNGL